MQQIPCHITCEENLTGCCADLLQVLLEPQDFSVLCSVSPFISFWCAAFCYFVVAAVAVVLRMSGINQQPLFFQSGVAFSAEQRWNRAALSVLVLREQRGERSGNSRSSALSVASLKRPLTCSFR